jgi:serine/threonine-protein kinase RsbW
MKNRGWSADEVFAVHLALEEALVNAIKHGNNGDSSKRVHLTCKLAPDRLLLEIKDEGPGFDPENVPDCTLPENLLTPSGRGLMLMRAYMSRVEFNAAGNCVTMEKIRSQAEASDPSSR